MSTITHIDDWSPYASISVQFKNYYKYTFYFQSDTLTPSGTLLLRVGNDPGSIMDFPISSGQSLTLTQLDALGVPFDVLLLD